MILASINFPASLQAFKAAGADGVIVAIEKFGIKANTTIQPQQIPAWKQACKDLGLQLYVNMLKMLEEQELDEVKDLLAFLQDKVDGIYYGDEGILYLAKQLGMEHLLIYQPETLVTSSLDARFYMSQGIQAVSLAHELSLPETLQIIENVPGCEVQAAGYFSILYSRRPLVSNYLHQIGSREEIRPLEIMESTRQERMPIVQDHAGTFIFSHAPKNSLAQLPAMQQAGLERIRIEGLFLSDDTVADLIALYAGKSTQADLTDFGSDVWYARATSLVKEDENGKN